MIRIWGLALALSVLMTGCNLEIDLGGGDNTKPGVSAETAVSPETAASAKTAAPPGETTAGGEVTETAEAAEPAKTERRETEMAETAAETAPMPDETFPDETEGKKPDTIATLSPDDAKTIASRIAGLGKIRRDPPELISKHEVGDDLFGRMQEEQQAKQEEKKLSLSDIAKITKESLNDLRTSTYEARYNSNAQKAHEFIPGRFGDIKVIAPVGTEKPKKSDAQQQRESPVSENQSLFGNDQAAATKFRSAANTVVRVSGKEAVLPIANRLGRGYDSFDVYASERSVRAPVLDLNALAQKGEVEVRVLDEFNSHLTIEDSLRKYVKKKAVDIATSGGFFCCSAEIKSSFTNEQTQNNRLFFATCEQVISKYNPYIRHQTDYRKYVYPDVLEDLKKLSPDDIFARYGQFILLDYIVGGKYTFNVTDRYDSSTTLDNFRLNVKAQFNALIAKAGGSTNVQISNTFSDYLRNCEKNCHIKGGISKMPNPNDFCNDLRVIQEWSALLKTEGVMVDFGHEGKSMIPIWDLIPDARKKRQVSDRYYALVRQYESKLPQEVRYGRRYITDLFLGSDYNEQNARIEALSGGSQILDFDLNYKAGGHKMFIAYNLSEPGDWKAGLTDMFISDSLKFKRNVLSFNHNGYWDNYRLLINQYDNVKHIFNRGRCNLNREAGSKHWLHLWRTWAAHRTKAPIYDIMVYDAEQWKGEGNINKCHRMLYQFIQNNPGWEPVYELGSKTPCNLNHMAGGHKCFLLVKKDYSVLPPNID